MQADLLSDAESRWHPLISSRVSKQCLHYPPWSYISTELPWQDTVIRVPHFEAEKRIVVFCETLAECFSNARPGYAKNWLKPRSFSYFKKKICWKATNTLNCTMSVPLWSFLFFYYLTLIITFTADAQHLIAVASGNRAWLLIPLSRQKGGRILCLNWKTFIPIFTEGLGRGKVQRNLAS